MGTEARLLAAFLWWSMLGSSTLGLVACAGPAAAPSSAARAQPAARTQVEAVLDRFHAAAARADGASYFDCLAESAVFIGTDASERWDRAAFFAYAAPHFQAGRGWNFEPVERHVTIAPGGQMAWFDERLTNAKYGPTRGSGVLVREGGSWKIAHYVLSLAIPNAVALDVARLVRDLPAEPSSTP